MRSDSMSPVLGGISRDNRKRLEALHREAKGSLRAVDAARILSIPEDRARRLLRYLAERGWLARVRRGLYVPVPLEARRPGQWQEDPWVVAARTFSPGYIGGWSACEHWGLTDQLFREIVVFTARRVRHRRVDIQGTPMRAKVVSQAKLFGTRQVWRRQVAVQVSDPSRTVVDILDDPEIGAGIRHVADVVREYFTSEHRDDRRLIDYIRRVGNRTVFKRLGLLIEMLGIDAPDLIDVCLRGKSAGITSLDPSMPAEGHIVSRWNLRLNAQIGPKAVE